jgi:hypothetical protein
MGVRFLGVESEIRLPSGHEVDAGKILLSQVKPVGQ